MSSVTPRTNSVFEVAAVKQKKWLINQGWLYAERSSITISLILDAKFLKQGAYLGNSVF